MTFPGASASIAREAVWDRLRQLRDELGTTIFLTTHAMEEADELCDRIAIMPAGVGANPLAGTAPPT